MWLTQLIHRLKMAEISKSSWDIFDITRDQGLTKKYADFQMKRLYEKRFLPLKCFCLRYREKVSF